jgi:hypothetical protein
MTSRPTKATRAKRGSSSVRREIFHFRMTEEDAVTLRKLVPRGVTLSDYILTIIQKHVEEKRG